MSRISLLVNARHLLANNLFNGMLSLAVCCLLIGSPAAFSAEKTAPGQSAAVAQTQAQVNINSATAEEIAAALNGVGIKRAEAIVAWRKTNGKFKAKEQLTEVKGIGPSILEKNKHRIVL